MTIENTRVLLSEICAQMEANLVRMQEDLTWIIGRRVYDIVRNEADLIAREMGIVWEKSLVPADLRRPTE
ncbi:MAG: hypothetical protein OXI54_11170 [Chloroflexota bacterium]|nr:hypothetical protein [Chloroflexota bacterium]MDE2684692.1 hypothetical protein [Chloroflexota bacterium]